MAHSQDKNEKGDSMKLTWFGHSTFKIDTGNEIIYVDPVRTNKLLSLDFDSREAADYVLVTHNHWDHCDPEAIVMVLKDSTQFIVPEEVMGILVSGFTFHLEDLNELGTIMQRVIVVEPGNQGAAGTCSVTVFKASEGVSFLVTGDRSILFMGDSTLSDEMLSAGPDFVIFPYYAFGEAGEVDKMSKFPETTRIGICHYHTQKNGMPNYYVEKNAIYEPLASCLRPLMLEKNKAVEL